MECESPQIWLKVQWEKREKTGRSHILRDILLISHNGKKIPCTDLGNTSPEQNKCDKSIPRHTIWTKQRQREKSEKQGEEKTLSFKGQFLNSNDRGSGGVISILSSTIAPAWAQNETGKGKGGSLPQISAESSGRGKLSPEGGGEAKSSDKQRNWSIQKEALFENKKSNQLVAY